MIDAKEAKRLAESYNATPHTWTMERVEESARMGYTSVWVTIPRKRAAVTVAELERLGYRVEKSDITHDISMYTHRVEWA